jgi:hypothetical protein
MSLMHNRHWWTRKLFAPFLYASAGVATANWLDYAFASFEPYGYPALFRSLLRSAPARLDRATDKSVNDLG